VTFLKKTGVFIVIVFLAIIVSALYGAIHNQISFSVAPEYFTKFKFRTFYLTDLNVPPRIGASIVGVLASWWMGIPLGILLGAIGFIHKTPKQMFRVTLWSMAVMMVFTLLFGLGGLYYGYLETAKIDPATYENWYIPHDVTDLRRFLCAGHMHNAAYLGAGIAVLVAWIFQVAVSAFSKAK